ncbi:uncharacterized protein [Paramormyrops kingsleyae]|uniref:Uncharacterized LOC111857107 n=1 Tax=Paramormyrops kingsleyae TaxID=1676925 RepID=A0A3B3RSU9_9TELE|nr:uncharacterized protein LOC111857107 [Paramormyrops kingsleyae]XP_023693402.1 uncharacterized protein LOC111857107 [Paramormyrops kingsleyae]XP_023693403.1 uncharacterized protein LOC111857107 [Paramormyrops kingsleyae]XP_023693404.1 uncharacterized protein LOC111857107 [Paramormyrops kingsleyae]XP_023693405.1 uncharacterized protein LOC111857107 [Paramormyrops kingsleyae]
MGPILQERAATINNKVSSKDRAWTKVTGNNGSATSNKKGKVNQNHRLRKAFGAQSVSAAPVHDSTPAAAKSKGTRVKAERPRVSDARINPHGTPWGQEASQVEGAGERTGSMSQTGPSRKGLSLPLPPRSDMHQALLALEPLRLREQEEADADSASDLSDSERLPVPPSPCTPPQLNLRAEVISASDLQPHFPGPRGLSYGSHSYPDFLPPPFNTWSLQQLAVFLNTEGRSAPRPRPVGHLEKYLERLLQLEWLQIQTIQEENGKPAAPVSVSRPHPRPHTAPATSLSSPKSLRQCQRAFPLAFLSSLAESSSGLLSGRVCPHCRIRYPFCNGTCLLYTYQHYSRLSPLLERRAQAGAAPRRSSSESRACASDRIRNPGSPVMGSSHLRRMQAAGNIRKPLAGQRLTCNALIGPSCAGTNGPKGLTKGGGASYVNVKGGSPRAGKERGENVSVGKVLKKDPIHTTDVHTLSRGLTGAKINEKQKRVKFVTNYK